jgi:SAM-dependent methyltransferase
MNRLRLSECIGRTKSSAPWHTKLGLKLVLSRLPISYHYWSKLNLFRHGQMDDSGYAWDIATRHLTRCLDRHSTERGFSVLEIGPGDSLTSAAVAHAFAAQDVLLLDEGDFARHDLADWHSMAEYLRARDRPNTGLDGARTLEEALVACSARHLTGGLRDLKSLPDASVDFVWSNAVFEHIRRDEFVRFQKELYRVMRRGGVASHEVDFKDHLGYSLNNLRFSERVWESHFFRNSGFYTNRIRYRAMIEIFETAGFDVEVVSTETWPALPLARAKLASPYRSLADDDLLVSAAAVILLKP